MHNLHHHHPLALRPMVTHTRAPSTRHSTSRAQPLQASRQSASQTAAAMGHRGWTPSPNHPSRNLLGSSQGGSNLQTAKCRRGPPLRDSSPHISSTSPRPSINPSRSIPHLSRCFTARRSTLTCLRAVQGSLTRACIQRTLQPQSSATSSAWHYLCSITSTRHSTRHRSSRLTLATTGSSILQATSHSR